MKIEIWNLAGLGFEEGYTTLVFFREYSNWDCFYLHPSGKSYATEIGNKDKKLEEL